MKLKKWWIWRCNIAPEEADEVCSMMRRQNGQDYHVPKEYYDEWIDMPFE